MTSELVGGVLGAMAAGGALLVVSRAVVARRPSLESRVAPYIRDVPTASPTWQPVTPSDSPSTALAAIARPIMKAAASRLERILGGRESVNRRLIRAGAGMSLEEFRLSQVAWGLSAFGATLVVGLLGPGRDPGRAIPWLLCCLAAGLCGVLLRDSALSRAVKQREASILAEFPVVADLIALSVAAGEGPVAALDRVVATCRGALPAEFEVVLSETRAGVPIARALDSFAQRSGQAIVARFAEGFAVAIERGTPLVDVLDAQTGDVREASKRALIETGGRKEVAMMIPVVFLIMPVTLLFAFFPGVIGLKQLVS